MLRFWCAFEWSGTEGNVKGRTYGVSSELTISPYSDKTLKN